MQKLKCHHSVEEYHKQRFRHGLLHLEVYIYT